MKCDWCERTDTITVINDRKACVDHLDNAFKIAFDPIGSMILWKGGQPGHAQIKEDS